MSDPTDLRRLAEQLVAEASPGELKGLLDALLSGHAASFLDQLQQEQRPEPGPVPTKVRGFRVRVDLHGAKPPVWRRLELPGDLSLPRLHEVLQAAMGWTDSHLHRFRTGRDPRSPYFLTTFDLDEGDEGVLEDDVRLDQLVSGVGDELWYDYDFGDGWEHRLKVEEVYDDPPAVRCLAGRMACPPEDSGGLWGYGELAAWVRSGYAEADLPQNFDDIEHGRDWLPRDWHPDHFDVAETNEALALVLAEPVAVVEELAELGAGLERRGIRSLRQLLARPVAHGPIDLTEEEAARVTEPYRILLDVIGDSVKLTGAGYLPPTAVEQLAERTGITTWWIGKANREDLTPPIAALRETARALGLITVRKGRLSPSAAALRCRNDPTALWRHIVGRLPAGSRDSDRQSGWMALAVAGSGVPMEQWRAEISELLFDLGWRDGYDRISPPSGHSQTVQTLEQLAGASRSGWRVTGTDPAVAATARAAIRR